MNSRFLAAIGGMMLAFGCLSLALDSGNTLNLVVFVILVAFGVMGMTYGLSGEEENPDSRPKDDDTSM